MATVRQHLGIHRIGLVWLHIHSIPPPVSTHALTTHACMHAHNVHPENDDASDFTQISWTHFFFFFFSHVTSYYYKKDQYRRLAESVHTGLIEKKGEKDTSDMKVNLTLPRCSADEHAQYG